MPSYRPPRRRRPVPAVVVVLLGLLSLWGLSLGIGVQLNILQDLHV